MLCRVMALALPPIFSADFTGLSLGGMSASAFLAATGLTFSRASTSTVQTDANTIDSTPAVDAACIGNAGYGQGLVLQPTRSNVLGSAGDNSPRNLTVAWTPGTATVTPNAAAGPDGQTKANHVVGTSGQYAPFASLSTANPYNFSCWYKGTNGPQLEWNNGAINSGVAVAPAASAVWTRATLAKGTANLTGVLTTVDCRDFSGVGGAAAQNRDVYIDFVQLEYGYFPTEAIPTGNTGRSPDLLSHAHIENLLDGGRLNLLLQFIPRFLASNAPPANTVNVPMSKWYLWQVDSSNYVRIDSATRKIEGAIGGTTFSTTTAMSWSAYGVVQIFVGVGGSQATTCKYRNSTSGAWTDLGASGTLSSIASTGTVALLRSVSSAGTDDYAIPFCWLQKVQALKTAASP